MPASMTWPSSLTSPVLINRAALSTVCGFWGLPEPRSSLASHFDGQRWLGEGGVQDGVCAEAAMVPATNAAAAAPNRNAFMMLLPCLKSGGMIGHALQRWRACAGSGAAATGALKVIFESKGCFAIYI